MSAAPEEEEPARPEPQAAPPQRSEYGQHCSGLLLDPSTLSTREELEALCAQKRAELEAQLMRQRLLENLMDGNLTGGAGPRDPQDSQQAQPRDRDRQQGPAANSGPVSVDASSRGGPPSFTRWEDLPSLGDLDKLVSRFLLQHSHSAAVGPQAAAAATASAAERGARMFRECAPILRDHWLWKCGDPCSPCAPDVLLNGCHLAGLTLARIHFALSCFEAVGSTHSTQQRALFHSPEGGQQQLLLQQSHRHLPLERIILSSRQAGGEDQGLPDPVPSPGTGRLPPSSPYSAGASTAPPQYSRTGLLGGPPSSYSAPGSRPSPASLLPDPQSSVSDRNRRTLARGNQGTTPQAQTDVPAAAARMLSISSRPVGQYTLRELRDALQNMQLHWIGHKAVSLPGMRAALDECFRRFGELASFSWDGSVMNDPSNIGDAQVDSQWLTVTAEAQTRRGGIVQGAAAPAPAGGVPAQQQQQQQQQQQGFVMSRICIRRFLNVFLVLYRHLYLAEHAETVEDPAEASPLPDNRPGAQGGSAGSSSRSFGLNIHHATAGADDFQRLSMLWDLMPAARINYLHDFPGMFNCVSQVVYFHNAKYERRMQQRSDFEGMNSGKSEPVHVLPCVSQIYPNIETLFEDGSFDPTEAAEGHRMRQQQGDQAEALPLLLLQRPENRAKWKASWIVAGKRVYMLASREEAEAATDAGRNQQQFLWYHPSNPLVLLHRFLAQQGRG